ncbi:MAG: nucleotidyl transferase AbiEii/AbiGii toxin family protein [Anaerolineales bacterium]|nr:nucleotidyl transferase AbiEii/AbiGii toxin family protein [Anaerolineales bacterium]
MKYKSASAFRQALELRLRRRSNEYGVSLMRLRKMVAFERFLVRLFMDQPREWVLKGGVAMQLRLTDRARTTKDIDLLYLEEERDLIDELREVGFRDAGDWFQFEISSSTASLPDGVGGNRFHVNALLDGRSFTSFPIDVGVGDPLLGSIEWLELTDLLDFAEIDRTKIPAYPVEQQIAEKVHAYTKAYASGSSSRVKDLVDILLLAGIRSISGKELDQVLKMIFECRGTHPLPGSITQPPERWEGPFQQMAEETKLDYSSLVDAYKALRRFLDPILSQETDRIWDPKQWIWV